MSAEILIDELFHEVDDRLQHIFPQLHAGRNLAVKLFLVVGS